MEEPETAIGLDFAFSVPAWFAEAKGWRGPGEVWRWAEAGTAADPAWVRGRPAPFWGPGIRPKPALDGPALRRTEHEVATPHARPASVFRLSGAGSVGAQSLWGMPHLLRLSDAGVAIWPFDAPRLPIAVEVFPRLMGHLLVPGAARLRGAAFRAAVVDALRPDQAPRLLGSQDVFDAAVAALAMARLVGDVDALEPARDAVDRIEGRILSPLALDTTRAPASRSAHGRSR